MSDYSTLFVPAAAILDRLMLHSHVLSIGGYSYRSRTKRKAGSVSAVSTDRVPESN